MYLQDRCEGGSCLSVGPFGGEHRPHPPSAHDVREILASSDLGPPVLLDCRLHVHAFDFVRVPKMDTIQRY